MHHARVRGHSLLSALPLALAFLAGACSDASSPSTGGATATGGKLSQGGATATGGVAQTGGVTATGGIAQTGGVTATGGITTGGILSTGGRTSTGGTASGGASPPDAGVDTSKATGGTATGGTPPATGGVASTGGVPHGDASTATGGTTSTDGGTTPGATASAGCGKTPTLKNSPGTSNYTQNTVTVGGKSRQYILRWPTNYDNTKPYRFIIGLHGATGKGADVAGNPAYFGLWDLAKDSTIFAAPSAEGGLWSAATDVTFMDEILKAVQADLCIDISRIFLEGFSQGAAMSWTIACSRPKVYRGVVGHSGGGVANPSTCDKVAYFGSGGLKENVTQVTQSDKFAKWNGCTVETLPTPPSGGHVCSNYKGCPETFPVRWCPFDGSHTPSPTDSGKSTSWMPSEVWPFISQF